MRIILVIICLVPWIIISQDKYPENYFSKPVEIPLILSGSFGELRSNHFHSGIDIKTQSKQGLNIVSSADGYVSRIKIAHGGFGKAIYVNHKNGYTTVYGHLKKFNTEIENYIKKIQYRRESYEVDVYLNENTLNVYKNQIIAFSGNTGGSSGPHLHYEIRKTSNQKPLNPLLFGMEVKDTRRPEIKNLFIYNDVDTNFNNLTANKLKLTKLNDSVFNSNEININGLTGFGINVIDKQDLANNKNGVYKISTYYNKQLVNSIHYDGFLFEESILINTLIDYKYYLNNKERIIKLFKSPGNTLSFYENLNNGLINKTKGYSEFKIKISDIKNNNTYVIIPLNSENKLIQQNKKVKSKIKYNKLINNDLESNFNIENYQISIPKNTFLKNVNLLIELKNDSLKVINPTIPVFKNIKILFPNYFNKKGNYLANMDQNNNEYFITSKLNSKNNFETKTKRLGTFFIKNDSVLPLIKSLSFKKGDWISNKNEIKFKILDKETGIKKYRGSINGKWVLFEYEYKKNEISYSFDQYYIKKSRNEVEIYVEDMVGNINILKTSFYRKAN
ncbi:M23 family metallopeptidase [Flavobacteriaceae bacterium]|nr:M23 family metallopeptidase [Flavobacteriaceae bacterium]